MVRNVNEKKNNKFFFLYLHINIVYNIIIIKIILLLLNFKIIKHVLEIADWKIL
jgi:hypothetical protein